VRLAVCRGPDRDDGLERGGMGNGGNAAAVVPRQSTILLQSVLFEESSAANKSDSATCPICLCEMVIGDICKELPICRHVYHTECIDEWLCRSAVCPLCRQDVVTEHQRLRVRVRHGRNPAINRELEMSELIQMHAAHL
jgi:hypothetical protein